MTYTPAMDVTSASAKAAARLCLNAMAGNCAMAVTSASANAAARLWGRRCMAARWLTLRMIAPGLAWIVALLAGINSSLAAGESAFSALAALPAEERANLARIEGPEGTPRPERWYFDVFAPDSENAVREYAVADRQIVARRDLSQFASNLTAEDVLDNRFLHTDSSQIEKLANEYAAANNHVIAYLSVTLAKPFHDARPVWTAHCYDASGAEFGCLVVAAENGTVFTHEGFSHEPALHLPPPMEIATGPKTEPSHGHARHLSPQRLPVERLAQRPPSGGGRVPPTPAATTRPAHRPWWSIFGH